MDNLLKSIELINHYESMDLESLVKEFEIYSDQKISEDIIKHFKLTGLSNIDFLTSDFLNQYNKLNIFQILKF